MNGSCAQAAPTTAVPLVSLPPQMQNVVTLLGRDQAYAVYGGIGPLPVAKVIG